MQYETCYRFSSKLTKTPFLCLTWELPLPVCQKHASINYNPNQHQYNHIHKVNGANGTSLGPIKMTICTLKFLRKFQQQFIVCKHLLQPFILGLDFSHNYLIGIDWFLLINCTFTKDSSPL